MSFRRLKKLIGGMFAALWTTGFAAIGRVWRRRLPRLKPVGGQTIWVVSPHPDDEVVGCAFAMLQHAEAGDRVLTIFVTDGRRSRARGLGPDQMAAARKREAQASQDVLGLCDSVWLGFPEGAWKPSELSTRLGELARSARPDVIYAPSRVDFHPEHMNVAKGLAEFLSQSEFRPVLRVIQIHVPITSILTNLVTSGVGLAEKAERARAAYQTQTGSIERTRRMRLYAGAFYRVGGEAEEYWQLSARAYCALHQDDAETWRTSKFQGVRSRSWSDPARYASGRAERRRLRALASNA